MSALNYAGFFLTSDDSSPAQNKHTPFVPAKNIDTTHFIDFILKETFRFVLAGLEK